MMEKYSREMRLKTEIEKNKMMLLIITVIRLWAASWALSDQLSAVPQVDHFTLKQIMAVLLPFNSRGISMLLIAACLGIIFFLMREQRRQKCLWISSVSFLFALCTLLGRSYMKTGSWDYIFCSRVQLVFACIALAGLFIIYKNGILFAGWVLEHFPGILRRETRGKAEKWLFERHPFLGPALVLGCLQIPWLVSFFPGTVEADGMNQLLMSLDIMELTGHHSIFVTKVMGGCLQLGRLLFRSDSAGIFLYTFPQSVLQTLSEAYMIYVFTRMKTPVLIRWGTLILYGIYPVFSIWGYTVVKDTGYYILMLLFVTSLAHMLYEGRKCSWLQAVLFAISTAGIGVFRNDGRIVVIFTLIYGIVFYKKYWKIFLTGMITCLIAVFVIEGLYMKTAGIPKGSVREALSIPLQQTARYTREHYEDITPEERSVLQEIFSVDLTELAEVYNPEFSDPVKETFAAYPDVNEMRSYLDIWLKQFLKHPDTYIQAFLHHSYGYFYPGKESAWEDIGIFDTTQYDYLDIKFGIKNSKARELLEGYARLVNRIPVIGILYHPGVYTFLLLGCIAFLMSKRRWKDLTVYIPGGCIVLICMASPVNACLRYTLPNIALCPMYLAWCYSVIHSDNSADKNIV